MDDIRETENGKTATYNLIRASDNSLLIDLIPTIIVVIIFIGAWIFFMRRMGGGGLGGREMSFGKAKIKKEGDKYVISFDNEEHIKPGYYIIIVTNSVGAKQIVSACQVV